jgi:Tfp pilus assembly protein PilN
MQDIDFLPLEYRQQHARRRWQPWRVAVVAVFLALLVLAVLTQFRQRWKAEGDLAAILPLYDEAMRQKGRLAEIHSQLQAAKSQADLSTYLRHPWPRTQLLAAVLDPLPDAVVLRQFHVAHETAIGQSAAAQRPGTDKKTDDEKASKLPAAQRDLKRLREELDTSKTLVRIAGTAKASDVLHRYLADLAKSDLFSKVELRSIERTEGNAATALRFQATLIVRPGYGQPGGPAGPAETASVVSHADGDL